VGRDRNEKSGVKRLLAVGQKIPAVMLYVDVTGMGFAEARRAVKAMEAEL
jgi:hypothetical protein